MPRRHGTDELAVFSVVAFLSLDLPGSKVVVGDGPARKKLEARFPGAHFVGEMRSSTDFHSRTIAPINPRSLHEARANDRESQVTTRPADARQPFPQC